MKLKLDIHEENEIERFLTVLLLGFLTALEEKKLSIEEVEGYLFNPHTVMHLQQMGINADIIKIVELGCELEDVASLLPYKLQETIRDLKAEAINVLERIPCSDLPTEKLIK